MSSHADAVEEPKVCKITQCAYLAKSKFLKAWKVKASSGLEIEGEFFGASSILVPKTYFVSDCPYKP